MRITLEEAIKDVAEHIEVDADLLQSYVDEDTIGGYNPKEGLWPSGSIWEVEGKILYALTRAIKPELVIEVGSNYGCSTSHFLAALDSNGQGKMMALDVSFEKLRVQSERLTAVCGDGIVSAKKLVSERVVPDILFEDGPHSKEFTRDILSVFLPVMKPGGLIVIHDVDHFIVGEEVSNGVREALGDFFHFLIYPSDCGLGYFIKS